MATKKYRLEDKVNGPEMDLSLQGLVDVPIREMALYRRVINLDLSNNHIRNLPDDFPEALIQLQTLDLSRNLIVKLPETFGQMSRIRHLDLFRNQLERLPMSISRMDKLRWLDVKENPLVAPLAKIVGDCLTTEECEHAAKNLVHFMRQVEQQCVVEKSNGKKYRELFEEDSQIVEQKKSIPSVPTKQFSSNLETAGSKSKRSSNLEISESKSKSKGMIPRSRTGIHSGAKAKPSGDLLIAEPPAPSFFRKMAGYCATPFNWTIRGVLYFVFGIVGISLLTGMIADYRVIQETYIYNWMSRYIPDLVLNGIARFQMRSQRYIAFAHHYFPYYPYIEHSLFIQAYEWICLTVISAFDAIMNLFKSSK